MRKDGITIRMPVGDCVIALAIMALGLMLVVGARAMGLGSFAMPGPGFFPLALGGVLIASGAIITIRALVSLRADTVTIEVFQRSVCVALLTLAWVGLTLERFGAEIGFAGFLLVWLKVFARSRWLVSVVVAIALALAVCGFFRGVLGVNLPRGPLGLF